MSDPRFTAARDQADAATRELLRHASGPDRSGLVRRLVDTMCSREANGQPTSCEHLTYRQPATAYWLPPQPHVVRCLACHIEIVELVESQPERHCDVCGAVVDLDPHFDQLVVAPRVTADDDGEPIVMPTTVIAATLCPACHRRSGLPTPCR